jgi:hypothetical protein
VVHVDPSVVGLERQRPHRGPDLSLVRVMVTPDDRSLSAVVGVLAIEDAQ